MTPMFASDFGNLGAYVLGVPALAIALLAGVVGAVMRVQSVQIFAGIICLLVGGFFYWSLSAAKADDRDFTGSVATISIALGYLVLAVSFLRRKKR
jgi:hypothetical protein